MSSSAGLCCDRCNWRLQHGTQQQHQEGGAILKSVPTSAAKTMPSGPVMLSMRVPLHGAQVVWRKYIQAMRQAGFGAGVGVYVASGLLTYGASQGMRPTTNSCTR